MKLHDLADRYHTAAILLQVQLREERALARAGDRLAADRAKQLGYVLTDLRKLRRLCAHYYDQPREPGWRL